MGPAPQPEPGSYTGPDAALPGEERGRDDAQSGDVLAELAELRRRVQQNDDEIDAMQIAAVQAQGRGAWWIRQPALLIAFFSLALAFGTTILSTVRLDQDQRHAARTELTGYIQRLTEVKRRVCSTYWAWSTRSRSSGRARRSRGVELRPGLILVTDPCASRIPLGCEPKGGPTP